MPLRGGCARALAAMGLAQPGASGRIVDILNGKRAITAETALRLGRYFGNGGRFWLALQVRYDLAVAEHESGARIAAEVSAAA